MILFCYLLILFAQNHTIITNNTANYIKIKSVILPLNQYFFDISLFFSFSPQSYPRQAFTSLYIYIYAQAWKIQKYPNKKNWHKKKPSETFFTWLSVPRAGVEPARIAPLVFETSASTDSAIWALFRVQRYNKFVN